MNWDRIQGNWKQVAGRVRVQWDKLTNDDLEVISGHREQLAGKIQERYGVAKDDAEKQISEWQDKATDSWFVHGHCLIFSCEHGGREVPEAYAGLFAGHRALLDSHRGWDPGALQLGRQMAATFGAPLFASTTTRLLIDLNRTIGHRQLHSEIGRGLTRAQQQQVVAEHYRPHRDAVESEIARRVADKEAVIHIASHSFTPVFGGIVRRADVAWLYDPRRPGETLLARRWRAALKQRAPGLRLRRNYPYQGRSDGLASQLRKRHPDAAYVGIELEVNQRFVLRGGVPWESLRSDLVESLEAALFTQLPRRSA